MDPVDEALIDCLKASKERRLSRENECNKNKYFCLEIAQHFDNIPERQCALAKLEILRLVTNFEYPGPEQSLVHFNNGYFQQ